MKKKLNTIVDAINTNHGEINKVKEELANLQKRLEYTNNRIHILNFTGTFDLDKVKIEQVNTNFWTDNYCIQATYVSGMETIKRVLYKLDDEIDHFNPQIKENDVDQTIFKVNSNMWFKLDKDEETIISIPAPAKYTKAETKTTSKK